MRPIYKAKALKFLEAVSMAGPPGHTHAMDFECKAITEIKVTIVRFAHKVSAKTYNSKGLDTAVVYESGVDSFPELVRENLTAVLNVFNNRHLSLEDVNRITQAVECGECRKVIIEIDHAAISVSKVMYDTEI